MEINNPETSKLKVKNHVGLGMIIGAGIGVALGAGIGAAFNNIVLGVGAGVALGPAMGMLIAMNKS